MGSNERGIDIPHVPNVAGNIQNPAANVAPVQPQNPVHFEGYTTMGNCPFQQGNDN